jgi:hypothetical protein
MPRSTVEHPGEANDPGRAKTFGVAQRAKICSRPSGESLFITSPRPLE